MTPDKVRTAIYISKEARHKLGKNPSRTVEDLAINKLETVEDMKKAFELLRKQIESLEEKTEEYNGRLKSIEDTFDSMTQGAD